MPEHSHAYMMLENFIRDEMRMSHIYQPVMLVKLLQNQGRAKILPLCYLGKSSARTAARDFVAIRKSGNPDLCAAVGIAKNTDTG